MHATADNPSRSGASTDGTASDGTPGGFTSNGLAVIDDLMAGGELLPAQLPSATNWSPAKKLAAAVLASALVEVRDHYGTPSHRRRVSEALEWVQSDDGAWPYAFLRLCALFDLEAEWVRRIVQCWTGTPAAARKSVSYLYRQAA